MGVARVRATFKLNPPICDDHAKVGPGAGGGAQFVSETRRVREEAIGVNKFDMMTNQSKQKTGDRITTGIFSRGLTLAVVVAAFSTGTQPRQTSWRSTMKPGSLIKLQPALGFCAAATVLAFLTGGVFDANAGRGGGFSRHGTASSGSFSAGRGAGSAGVGRAGPGTQAGVGGVAQPGVGSGAVGNVSITSLPGQQGRLTFADYLKAGGSMALDVDLTINRPFEARVSTYLDSPKEPVTPDVHSGKLDNNATYPASIVLEAKGEKLKVTVENSGCRPASR